jgi:ankyrin repeat protein
MNSWGALVKKTALLLMIFCKGVYCNNFPAIRNYKFKWDKQKEDQSNQAFASEARERLTDQSTLSTFDSVSDVDKAENKVEGNPVSLQTDKIPELTDKKNSPTTLGKWGLILGSIGVGGLVALYKYLVKHVNFTQILSRFSSNRNNILRRSGRAGSNDRGSRPGLSSSVTSATSMSIWQTIPIPFFDSPKIVSGPSSVTMQGDKQTALVISPERANELGLDLIKAINRNDNNNIDEIAALIEQGANFDVKGDFNTPLGAAVWKLRLNVVNLLLRKGAKIGPGNLLSTAKHDDEGRPYNRVLIARALLDKGADINEQNDHGDTPLAWAVSSRLVDLVGFFLRQSAKVNTKSYIGRTPLHYAANKHCQDEGERNKQARTEIVNLLLENNADVNAQDDRGETPLHLAVRSPDQEEIVRLLLKKGARIDIKNNEGKTPVDNTQYSFLETY